MSIQHDTIDYRDVLLYFIALYYRIIHYIILYYIGHFLIHLQIDCKFTYRENLKVKYFSQISGLYIYYKYVEKKRKMRDMIG